MVESRQRRHGVLQREADPLFDFERRVARRRRVDGHLHVGDVRHGIDGQPSEIPRAQPGGEQHEHEHQAAMRD